MEWMDSRKKIPFKFKPISMQNSNEFEIIFIFLLHCIQAISFELELKANSQIDVCEKICHKIAASNRNIEVLHYPDEGAKHASSSKS